MVVRGHVLLVDWVRMLGVVVLSVPVQRNAGVVSSVRDGGDNGSVAGPAGREAEEGLTAMHPVVFVPGIVTGGLELWEGHQCAEGLFRKRLWGGTFGELYRRYWLLGSLLRINSGAS